MAERACSPGAQAGRLRKARQFRVAAEVLERGAADVDQLLDAYVTMCIHAGIAAADVICCKALGVHHQGDNHHEAVALLGRVDTKLGGDLAALLRKKAAAGYSDRQSSGADGKQVKRAMERLVDAAEAAMA